ncbi:MAG: hypothetical protein FRX48_03045 [Lasallia pustulata]|uniref:Uncharacterized protein n=1 Tax=Lasallia pustulata TaxID=136370 RepID=A0A5M8PW45_9LECA|nr:MAG: hypothetical protein FRX48_03045 [Lasallia pustulata]
MIYPSDTNAFNRDRLTNAILLTVTAVTVTVTAAAAAAHIIPTVTFPPSLPPTLLTMSSIDLLSAPEDESYHASWDDLRKTLDDWAVFGKFAFRTPKKEPTRATYRASSGQHFGDMGLTSANVPGGNVAHRRGTCGETGHNAQTCLRPHN